MISSEKLIAKAVRVVMSCETGDQLRTASRYVQAVDRRLNRPCRIGFRATVNAVFDVVQCKINEEKSRKVPMHYLFPRDHIEPQEIARQREKLIKTYETTGRFPEEVVLTPSEADLIRYQVGLSSPRGGDALTTLLGIPVVVKENRCVKKQQ